MKIRKRNEDRNVEDRNTWNKVKLRQKQAVWQGEANSEMYKQIVQRLNKYVKSKFREIWIQTRREKTAR